MDGWHEGRRQRRAPTDWLHLSLFLITPVNLVNPLPPPAVHHFFASMLFPNSLNWFFKGFFFVVVVFITSYWLRAESLISLQIFILVNSCYTSLPSSFSPLHTSLRGNLLGIAPLLSSQLSGCCCCHPYSVTSVCTQPGAPSNTTSLTHAAHAESHIHIFVCVCVHVLNTHLVYLFSLLYLCVLA